MSGRSSTDSNRLLLRPPLNIRQYSMRTPLVLLCLLVAMCGVMVACFMTEEAPTSRGVEHSKFETMREGGSEARHGHRVLMLGWAFAVLQIALYVGCLVLGTGGGMKRRGFVALLILSGFAYAGVFTLMVTVYAQTIRTAETEFLGSFPAATSWMLYALWPIPLLFVLCYVAGFSRWVWTPINRRRFEEILAAREIEQEVSD